jgi:SagB-type dehydrogenase family enzyme
MDYEGIGDKYHSLTKYARGSLPRHNLDWNARPPIRKSFPDTTERVDLPNPKTEGGPALWSTIRERRSERAYTHEPMTADELSQLLWATQGTTRTMQNHQFRAAPSAGALYPIETHVIVNRVDGLDAGLYHYDAFDAALDLIKKGDFGEQAAAAALDQKMVERAAVVFVWTAVPERSKWKYLERAYRYIYMDVGHIAQNLYLAATALGLGCCAIGALYDDEANRLVGADGESETVVYMCSVGRL